MGKLQLNRYKKLFLKRRKMKTAIINWIKKHQLISFFALTYLITFKVQFLYAFLQPGKPMQNWSLVWFFSVFSPSISALIISAIIGGMAEVKRLLSGFKRWKVGLVWYLAAAFLFLGPLLIVLIYRITSYTNTGGLAGITMASLLGQVVFNFFSGPFSEELGWRGFAFPRLQAKHNALVSSLILGVIHTFWHLPLYFIAGSSQMGIPMPIYLVLVTSVNIYINWLYNNTRGSLVIAVLAHFAFDATGLLTEYLKLMPPMLFNMTSGPLLGVLVIVIVIVFGAKHLSKKPVSELPIMN